MSNKSLEAYNVLLKAWQGNKETEEYPNFDDINEAFYVIKQDLERFEKLKKAIDIFKRELFIEFSYKSIHLKDDEFQYYDYTILSPENEQEYDLLKEVLGGYYG